MIFWLKTKQKRATKCKKEGNENNLEKKLKAFLLLIMEQPFSLRDCASVYLGALALCGVASCGKCEQQLLFKFHLLSKSNSSMSAVGL